MSDARRYAVWPEPRSRSLKGSRPSVPHGTNFLKIGAIEIYDDDDDDNEVQHLHGQSSFRIQTLLKTDLSHLLLEFMDI